MIFTAASVLALAVSALAQTAGFDAISKPTKDEKLTAGDIFDITWEPSTTYTGTVSIALLGGATPSTLQVLSTISSGVKNSAGSYSWSIGSDLGDLDTYGIRISLDSDTSVFQYSYPFGITKSSATTAAGTSSSSSTSVAVSTTSSAVLAASLTTSSSSTVSSIAVALTNTTSCVTAPATSTAATVVAHANNITWSAATTLTTAVSAVTKSSSNHTAIVVTSTASATGNQTTAASATPTYVQSGAASNAANLLAALVGGLAVSFFLC